MSYTSDRHKQSRSKKRSSTKTQDAQKKARAKWQETWDRGKARRKAAAAKLANPVPDTSGASDAQAS